MDKKGIGTKVVETGVSGIVVEIGVSGFRMVKEYDWEREKV